MEKKQSKKVEDSDNKSGFEGFENLPPLVTKDTTGVIKPLRQRRHFTESARKAILAQIDKGELSVTSASRAYGVAGNTIYTWRYKYNNISPKPIKLMDISEIVLEREKYEKHIAELEQLLGQKEVRIALLEKALSLASPTEDAKKK
jgi:transposase-like protein